MSITDEQFLEKLKSPFLTDDISIAPIHDDSEKLAKTAYLESGSCEEGAVYHFACECGHIGKNTYTVDAHEHNLVHHEAKAADCCNDGWEAYDTCEDCGYTTFKAIPAKGHDMVHHEALPATCTEDGSIEHWRCEECGKLFADSEGLIELTSDEITVLHTDHIWSDWIITKEPTTSSSTSTTTKTNSTTTTTKTIFISTSTSTTSTTTTTTSSTTSSTTTTMPFETVNGERFIGTWSLYKYFDKESGDEKDIGSNESYTFDITDDFKCIVTYEDKENGVSNSTECLWTASETETGGKNRILIVNPDYPSDKIIAEIKDGEISFDAPIITGFMKKKPDVKHGDINEDGRINPVDASKILIKFAELSAPDAETPSAEVIAKYDINGDGRITAVDASLLLAYCANLAGDETLTLDAFLADKIKN